MQKSNAQKAKVAAAVTPTAMIITFMEVDFFVPVGVGVGGSMATGGLAFRTVGVLEKPGFAAGEGGTSVTGKNVSAFRAEIVSCEKLIWVRHKMLKSAHIII